jgi:hypothetical protein
MESLVAAAAFLVVPLFMGGFAWFAVRVRRRGSGHSMVAPFEEIWDPGAHNTHLEIQVGEDRAAKTPSPGDPPTLRRKPRPSQ